MKRTKTVKRVEDLSGYFAYYRTGIVVSTPTFYNGRQPRKKQNLLQAFQGQTSLRCESFDFKLKMSGWENCFHISSHTLPLLFFFFFILVSRNLSLGGGYDENPETWPKFLVLLWSFSIFVNFFFLHYRL